MHDPTPEQRRIIECEGNVAVVARPGSGKTFTLAKKITEVCDGLLGYQGVIALSYTNKASDELKTRCEQMGLDPKRSYFGTIDGFCLSKIVSGFAKHVPGCGGRVSVVESGDESCDESREYASKWLDPEERRWNLAEAALAKGEVPLSAITETALYLIDELPELRQFLKARFTHVFIDEYQDCGLAQHLLLLKLVDLGLSGIVVGDLDQAIYDFHGKSSKYFKNILEDERFNTFSITENHRCHPDIVSYSLRLLNAGDLPVGPEGERRVKLVYVRGDERSIAAGIDRCMAGGMLEKYGSSKASDVAILGRSNYILHVYQELLETPTHLFSRNVMDDGFSRWKMLFRDLIAFLYGTDPYPGSYLDANLHPYVSDGIKSECFRMIDRLRALPDGEWACAVSEFVSLARLIDPEYENEESVADLSKALEDITSLRDAYSPSKDNEVNLLTYHKAKGLEFDIVFCLESYAFQMPLDNINLHYVGLTRARKVCYLPVADYSRDKYERRHRTQLSPLLTMNGLGGFRDEIEWRF